MVGDRWFAYTSIESGSNEVYVTSFPGAVGKWQISTAGGAQARWRGDGREIFYLSAGRLMAAEVNGQGTGFQVNNARELFDARARGANIAGYGVGRQYDVSSDGRRFLVSAAVAEESSSGAVTLVVDWTAGLAR